MGSPRNAEAHTVAVLALESSGGIDISIPCMIFGQANRRGTSLRDGHPLYDLRICGPTTGTAVLTTLVGGAGAFGLIAPYSWSDAASADTILVPGLDHYLEPPPSEVVDLLRDAHSRGVRVGGICNGVFVLAAAGLLDGRRVATHWTHGSRLAARHPDVRVDDAVLFLDDGDIVTTAGGAATLDLCLHLVRRDHGSAVAAATAQHTVMPPLRAGGQAQFVAHAEPDSVDSIEPVLLWMEEHLGRELTLDQIADQAALSVRTLNRRFRAQTGTTPLRWLIQRRLQRARELLERTDLSVEDVASWSGFGTAVALRQHFRRAMDTTPLAYRRAFAPADPKGREPTAAGA